MTKKNLQNIDFVGFVFEYVAFWLYFLWALRDSNPRPSACKADALNQLS